jgi:hypothetical protein
MFRMLVLQALDNLSDEQVEYQVRDRLSFTSCWVKRCKPHPRSSFPFRLIFQTLAQALQGPAKPQGLCSQ